MASREQWIRHGLFGGILLLALGAVWLLNAGDERSGARDSIHISLTGEGATIQPALEDFDRVRLKIPAKIDITAGRPFAVSISADRAVLDHLEARVEDGTLIVGPKPEKRRLRLNDAHIEVAVSLPKLTALRIDGAVEGDVEGLDGGDLALAINGAADIDLAGRCERLDVTVNGAASISARPLKCADVRVTLNGAGNASVHASRSIRGQINGVGNVTVYGHPSDVEIRKGGFGHFELRDEDENDGHAEDAPADGKGA